MCVCDLALQRNTLCYEYEWHDVRLHVSMRVGVGVNGTECEPPAVLFQTHTYNTDGVMTFCTSDSCGVFSITKAYLTKLKYMTWGRSRRYRQMQAGFLKFWVNSLKAFQKSVHILSLSSAKHNMLLQTFAQCWSVYSSYASSSKAKNYNDVGR